MFMTILYTSTQILYQINVNFNGLTMLAFIVDILINYIRYRIII